MDSLEKRIIEAKKVRFENYIEHNEDHLNKYYCYTTK